ncbi:MAG: membrane protein insertion efficiency factor YidD [Pseudomonadota bacterium]
MKLLALYAIRFYQRFISPRKGFCCAYASVTGHPSCSALGYRAIRRWGVWRGIGVLDLRLAKCGVAFRRHVQGPLARGARGALGRQGGFADCSCDGPSACELPCDSASGCNLPHLPASCDGASSCEMPSFPNACDSLQVLDCCDCDWRRRKQQDEQYVVIPVRGNVSKHARQAGPSGRSL